MDKKNFVPTLYPLDRNMGKHWFVTYYDHGCKRKKYGNLNNISNKKKRLEEADRIIKQLLEPEEIRSAQYMGLIGNLEAVLDYKRPQLEDKSYQSYFSFLRGFAAWYHLQPKNTDPAGYIRHMYVQKYHPNYILRCKITLGSWFKELVKQRLYPCNPFADIKIKKLKSQSLLPYHPKQIEELKNLMLREDPQLWIACLFQYYLLFRPKEIRMLKIENILFDEGMVSVGHDITKDDDVLLKAIPDAFKAIIEQFRTYPPNWYIFSYGGAPGPKILSRDQLSKRHRIILDIANYSHRYAFYSWVHTGAKEAIMAGIPAKQLQLQKGHSDLKMFDEYLKKIGVNECTQMIRSFPAI